MPLSLVLRPYQRGALDAVYGYWQQGGGNPLVVLPTGAGKSLVIAKLCQELLAGWPNLRIGIVTHVKELVAQNAQELIRTWPGAPVGIYSAGLNRRDLRARIMFMGIQSVWNKVGIVGDFDVLLIDECHLIGRDATTRYGRFIDACRERVPHLRIMGLTATPYRLDSGRLDRGSDRIFDDIVYEANVLDLISDGYLSPLTSRRGEQEIDTKGVHVRGGEFVAEELEARARVPTLVEAAVAEIVEAGRDRHGWLLFGSGVDHAHQIAEEVRKHQVSCEVITGATPGGERDRIVNAYKQRKIKCLVSVGVLTTGFNAPHVDLIGMMMSTLSTVKYVQIVGRAFRPIYAAGYDLSTTEGRHEAIAAGTKPCALILDFGGNVRRHGPIDAVKPRKVGGGSPVEADEMKADRNAILAKECPKCRTLAGLAERRCLTCGFEWPAPVAGHDARPDTTPILSIERPAPQWVEVTDIAHIRHQKLGMPDSLRVEVTCGFSTYREWMAFEHHGRARGLAQQLWIRLGGLTPIPATVTEALERIGELRRVSAIRLDLSGEYPRIVGWRTADRDEVAA